jgi:DinB superfamily
MNSYMRFKLALTEDTPTVKPYNEADWANLPEAKGAPIDTSLDLLDALHGRWVLMLRAMSESDWQRTFRHPGLNATVRLDTNLALYAWHGRHHLAHIVGLKQRMGW